MTIQECITRMEKATARMLAGLASLTLTVERWEMRQAGRVPNTLAAMMAGNDLPRWKGKGNGRGRAHSMRTAYLRSQYNANDIAMLEKVLQAQPRVFTFEQTMALKSKHPVDTAQIERIRNGQV